MVRNPLVDILQDLKPSQRATDYGTPFEVSYLPETALLNYAYLDLLERARHALNWTVSRKQGVYGLASATSPMLPHCMCSFSRRNSSGSRETAITCVAMVAISSIMRTIISKIGHIRNM